MKFRNGIIAKNILNIHKEPSTDSEMLTQGVMGQQVVIEEETDNWLYIQTWDSYHGWVLRRWIISSTGLPHNISTVNPLFTDLHQNPTPESSIITKLVITSEIGIIETSGNYSLVRLPDDTNGWIRSEDLFVPGINKHPPSDDICANILHTAQRFIGVPYLWGGSTPFGLDCSGFTQLVYKINGIMLLRDSSMQAEDPRGTAVDKDDLATGDLVFFAGGDGSRINHVGIARGDGSFIHSEGKGTGVTVNMLEDEPYNRIYRCARRMIIDHPTPSTL
ncbi:MAG: C40 family peptidase [Armatimonadota bacterium]